MGGSIVSAWMGTLLIGIWAVVPMPLGGAGQPEGAPQTPPTTQPAKTEAEATAQPEAPMPEDEPAIKPRFEVHARSLRLLVSEIHRSRSGALAEHLGRMLMEWGSLSSEGMDVESAAALLKKIKGWPDTAMDAALYAPDLEGRQRWAVRLDWPVEDLYARLQPLLSSEVAGILLEEVRMLPLAEGGYEIALPTVTLAYLLPAGDTQALVASHTDIEFPAEPFSGTEDTEKGGSSLLVCRLNLKGTEKDSGATFWSSFSAFTEATYDCRVDEDGHWVEVVRVQWPPIVGTGAKAAMGKVKQTFFVPSEAYGSLVLNPRMGPGMLENMAGFGPQMMMEESGSFTIMGEAAGGPISANVDSQMCITILPGTGFMPVPDFVIQVKTKHAEKLIESIRKATKKINKLYRRREQPRPWHKATVKDRPIFWSNAGAVRGAILMPWVMRPVLFVTTETDARDRERDFLVLAFTTTSPKNLVRRWIEMPRPKDRRFLPEKRKVHGQMWVNWEQTYKWIQPYLNLSLSIVSRDLLLPSAKEMSDKLTDASLTMKVRYEGVRVSHRGPIPAGVVAVPTLLGIASEMESRGSDLARERSACRRLKVFYHHAKLFERDMGRWPAELAELDGYIDFAGHPYLTRLELSPKKRRSDWFESVIESDDEDEEDEEEEEDEDEAWISIDDDQFVIEWGRELWTLGVAPGTFEHLDNLYIDQDGNIHRVEKKPAAESDGRKDKDHEDNDSDNE